MAREDDSLTQGKVREPLEPHELRIPIAGGLTLAAKAWGDASGEPWLALHGWLDNANSFDILAHELHRYTDGAFYLVCVEHAGHGLSCHRPGGVYHFIDYCADASAVADALGWERFGIMGHSLGGSVASLVASTLKDRVTHLVLLETIGPFGNQAQEAPEAFRQSLKAEMRPPSVYPTLEAAAQRRADGNVVGKLPYDAAMTLAIRGVQTSTTSPGMSWRYDPGLKVPSRARLTHRTIEAYFSEIACPTYVVLADDGLFQTAKILRQPIFSFTGRLLLSLLYPLVRAFQLIPFIGKSATVAKIVAKARLGLSFAKRFSLIRKLTWKFLPTGGHHPHMSPYLAPSIAFDIASWRANHPFPGRSYKGPSGHKKQE